MALVSCKTWGDRREGAANATPKSAANNESLREIIGSRREFTDSPTKQVTRVGFLYASLVLKRESSESLAKRIWSGGVPIAWGATLFRDMEGNNGYWEKKPCVEVLFLVKVPIDYIQPVNNSQSLEYPVLYRFRLRNAQELSRDKALDKIAHSDILSAISHAGNSNYHSSQTGLSRPDLVGRVAPIAIRTKCEEALFVVTKVTRVLKVCQWGVGGIHQE